jgi:hypothetical protein
LPQAARPAKYPSFEGCRNPYIGRADPRPALFPRGNGVIICVLPLGEGSSIGKPATAVPDGPATE